MTEANPRPHTARGVFMAVVFGPVLIVGVFVAASALLSSFVSGWMPSRWFSGSAADWLVGGGVTGDAVNYVGFMIGGLLAAVSWTAIRWGFTGGRRDQAQHLKNAAFLTEHEKQSAHQLFEHVRESDETATAWVATRSSDRAGVGSHAELTTPAGSSRGVLFLTNRMLWFCSVGDGARGYYLEKILDVSFDPIKICLTISLSNGNTVEFEGEGDIEDYRRLHEHLRATRFGPAGT